MSKKTVIYLCRQGCVPESTGICRMQAKYKNITQLEKQMFYSYTENAEFIDNMTIYETHTD